MTGWLEAIFFFAILFGIIFGLGYAREYVRDRADEARNARNQQS